MEHRDFETAHKMAKELVRDRTDPNEASKALEYLIANPSGERFFEFLQTIESNGFAVVRSNQTIGYYRSILDTCEQHLRIYQSDPDKMSKVLGWAIRLMRFYRVVPKYIAPTGNGRGAVPARDLKELRPGMVVKGIVKDIKSFGAFVDIGVGYHGLVHISELAHGFVENVSDIVKREDEVEVKIISIDFKRNRISLSMKDMPKPSVKSNSESTTLGDVFGKMLKKNEK